MFKTIFFGLVVNILILLTLGTIIEVTGLNQWLLENFGQGYTTMFVFAFIWGMGGAFISLLISKWLAKTFNGVQIVDEKSSYRDLVYKVHEISRKAGLPKMPEVGVYQSPEINAFATGPSKSNSLVAVSTGLLERMDSEEAEGVLAHEVAHIANGDMVTMTFIQGVVNSFVYFLAFVLTQIIANATRSRDGQGGGLGFFGQYMIRQLLIMVLGFMAYPIVAWFSRWREYRADYGSGVLVGKHKMVKALKALQRNYPNLGKADTGHAVRNISSKVAWAELFSTHPPLEKRIKALN